MRRMSTMTVRPATATDLPGVLAASAGLWREDAGTRDTTMNLDWPYRHGETAFRSALTDPGRLVLVVDHEHAVVGFLSAGIVEPDQYRAVRVATLNSMFVLSPYRGRGLGAELVAQFREWAGLCGADRIAVNAYASNSAAIRFYQKVGFTPYTLTLEGSP